MAEGNITTESSTQTPSSYAEAKAETLTQPEHQLEELISYLDTREDISEVSTPSGGLVRVKNKDGLYNYFGRDKKVISENWFNDAKDFHELVPDSNKFVAMVGKKTEETGIHAGIDYYFIDTHGEIAELSDSETLPQKPIFHLPEIDEEKISVTKTQYTDINDKQLLTDQEIERAKKIEKTKQNFKGSGIVEFVEYLRDNYFLTISGKSVPFGENFSSEKLQRKINHVGKRSTPMFIKYDNMNIILYYDIGVGSHFLMSDNCERVAIEKRDSDFKLKYYPEWHNEPEETITSSEPEKIIAGIMKVTGLGKK